ncbi:MAG: hypothetical protein ABRQ39_25700 [Candidatus Eremiobacterota bacterium]
MVINLYEVVINENNSRSFGRIIGKIMCTGDGTPGKVEYYDTCKEVSIVRCKHHPLYGTTMSMFDDFDKKHFSKILNNSIYITTDGGWNEDGTVHHSGGRSLMPWKRETLEYILKYELPASLCASICGEIVED